MQNVFRSLFSLSLAWTFGVIAPPAQAESPQTPSFCTTGAAPGTSTPGSNGLGLFQAGQAYFASLVPGPTPPACLWATPARYRLDLPQLPGLGNARLNLSSGLNFSSLTGLARRITATTISPVVCTSFLDIANLPPGISANAIFALDLTNGGGTRLGGNCTQPPGTGPERCLWGVGNFAVQFGQGNAASGLSGQLVTNAAGLPYLQCFDATMPNSALGPGSTGALFFDDFEPPVPNVRVEFLADSGAELPSGELVHAIGGSAFYRVQISNRSGLPLTGIHIREFVPGVGGSISPPVVANSCAELPPGGDPINCPSTRLDRQIDLAPQQSRVFRLQRSVTDPDAVEPGVGGLLAVAAFVHPDQGADSDPADNVRSLRLGTVREYTVTALAGPNGSVSPESQPVVDGGIARFTVTPSAGFSASATPNGGCGQVAPASGNMWTAGPITGNCSINFTFSTILYTVNTQVVGNGTITPATRLVPAGESTLFTLRPAANHVIQSVTGCGGELTEIDGVFRYIIKSVQSNCTVTATFALVTYTVTSAPTTNGTITINTPTVPQGQPATFTLTPSVGYSANTPTGTTACGNLTNTGGNNWSTGPITSNGCEISATFTLNQYQVTVTTSGGNGTISPVGGNPGTSPVVQTVGHGSTASVAVTPAVGHSAVFGAASVGNCTFNPPATSNVWTSSAITGTCAVDVTFARNSYTVTAERSPSNPADSVATIVPATQQVLHDDDATITVTVNTGFRLVTGSATGCPGIQVSPDANNIRRFFITVSSVQAACTVAITSERLPPPP